jgi:DNA polymerase-1
VKLLLLDGNSLTYRAFFALPTDMATASGQVTNAVFGFTSMLINLLKDHRPDGIMVAFDRPEPTFRHEQHVEYKAQREAAPDILRQQMGLVRQVLEALRITMVELAGWEATTSSPPSPSGRRPRARDHDRDRRPDVYQLVEDPLVGCSTTGAASATTPLRRGGIFGRTGVTPAQYVDYAALRGDPSDNLPGVPGWGRRRPRSSCRRTAASTASSRTSTRTRRSCASR